MRSTGSMLRRSLPLMIRETSRRSSTILTWVFAFLSIRSRARSNIWSVVPFGTQHINAAQNGRERSSQFVRNHGDELVLETIGSLRFVVKA